jgi:hypothetical protein
VGEKVLESVPPPPPRTPSRTCELIQLAGAGAASLIITKPRAGDVALFHPVDPVFVARDQTKRGSRWRGGEREKPSLSLTSAFRVSGGGDCTVLLQSNS